MNRKGLFFVSLLILISSCKTASPRLTNLHTGIYKIGQIPNGEFLDVQVAIIPIVKPKTEPQKAKTFFDLRDSIPQTFLRVLGEDVTTGSDLIKYIKEPLSKDPEELPTKLKTDFATQKVRFVIGNIKNYQLLASEKHPEFLHPNTRLVSLNTKLNFSTSDFEIVSIDKLESEFEEIDLGTLSRTQEVNFNSKLTGQYGVNNTSGSVNKGSSQSVSTGENGTADNIYDADGNIIGTITSSTAESDTVTSGSEESKTSTKGFGASGEVGYNNKETIIEALQVKLKRLKTGFVFNREGITISQHGSNLLDISDNIIVTATIIPKTGKDLGTNEVMYFSGLFKDNKPQNACELKLNRREIKYMKCEPRKVEVSISSKGLLRAVENKMRGNSNLEFDDKVIYYPFDLVSKTSNSVPISNWPNCTQLYKMEYKDATSTMYDLMAGIGNIHEVRFVDGEKDLFSSWLRIILANPTIDKLKHPSLEIYLEERVVSPGLAAKRIKIVGPSMTVADVQKAKNLDIQFKSL